MSSKEIQYISIIKMEQNVKIAHQVFTNNKLLTDEQSVFLLDNGQISNDALFKIKVLENEIENTIITAICEDGDQTIIDRHSAQNKNDIALTFDLSHNIVLGKESVKMTKSFYNNGNIDYLISPFTILNEELILNPISNSLNIFIFNNTLYSIFFNEHKRLAFSSVNFLTPYNDIKKSNFYTDEVVEQILYDEIYLLELGSNITEILNGYYELTKSSNFCEFVNIYYTIKYLEPKQIELLKENILLDIAYSPLNIDTAVEKIVKKENIGNYSYTKKRAKKSKYAIFAWLLIAILTTFGAGYSFYIFQSQEEEANLAKLPHKEIAKIEYANLPNHIAINQNFITLITSLFESIDDNSLLKEIQIQQNESTIIYDFKATNPYEQSLKPKLLKIYEQSENILTSQHKGIFTSIISNVHLINKNELPLKKYIPNQNAKFLSSSDGKKGIEQLFNTSSIVKLQNETKEKYTTYTYTIFTIIKSPIEFFDIIKLLEKQNYSIALDYPIEFAKTNKGLELNFKLTINQNNQTKETKTETEQKSTEQTKQTAHTEQPQPTNSH